MKKFIQTLILLLTISTFAQNQYRLKVSGLNVREKPTVNSKKINIINKHDQFIVLDSISQGGWYKIKFKNQIGYISNKYIEKIKPNTIRKTKKQNGHLGWIEYGLIFYAILFMIGTIFGFTNKVTIFLDFSDLTKTFFLIIFPIIYYFLKSTETYKTNKMVIDIAFGILMIGWFIWVLISTYKANTGWLTFLIAILVKIPLSIIIVNYALKIILPPEDEKNNVKNLQEMITAGMILLFLLKLVKHKVWIYNPTLNYNENIVDNIKEQLNENKELSKKYKK
jgi:uncharacterized protein YgiM (DUF1202 family)